jgi:hypothetical protein
MAPLNYNYGAYESRARDQTSALMQANQFRQSQPASAGTDVFSQAQQQLSQKLTQYGVARGQPGFQPSSPEDISRVQMNLQRNYLANHLSTLQTLGPSLRSAVLSASPELTQASSYLMGAYQDPFGGNLPQYQDSIRQAMEARGFSYNSGAAPAGQEAAMLTGYANQRRSELSGQLTQFGTGVMQLAGVEPPKIPDFAQILSGQLQSQQLGLQAQQQSWERQRTEEESSRAQTMYNDYLGMLRQQSQRDYGGLLFDQSMQRGAFAKAFPEPERFGSRGTASINIASSY